MRTCAGLRARRPSLMRTHLFLTLLLVVASLVVPAAQSAPGAGPPPSGMLRQKFEAELKDIARRLDGVMSYAVVDLTSGERFTLQEQTVSPTASTIKLAVLYELMRQVDDGRVKLETMLPLDRRHAVGGGAGLEQLGTPILSIRDYATLMAVLSDNTATNVLINLVGMSSVNDRMRQLGLRNTLLRRRMMDVEAARRGDENVSTAAEVARLLEALYRGEGLSPQGRDEALTILKKEKAPASAMLKGIPVGVPVANKPGELEGVRVDAGIVFVPNRPYVFSVMTTYLQEDAAGDAAIEQASRVTYQYFSRLGAGGQYGRQIGR
jgi:beta-lactamase class A